MSTMTAPRATLSNGVPIDHVFVGIGSVDRSTPSAVDGRSDRAARRAAISAWQLLRHR